MPRVHAAARPHPATVTALSEGSLPRRRRAKKSGQTAPKSALVVLSWDDIADLRVRTVARSLAKGDRKRVELISPTDVIVHNPGWKK